MDKRGQATLAGRKQPHTRKRKEPDQAAPNMHEILRQKNIAAHKLKMQELGLLEAAAEVDALAQAPKKPRKAPQPRLARIPTERRRSSRNEGKVAVVYYAPPEVAVKLPKGRNNRVKKLASESSGAEKEWPHHSIHAIEAAIDAAIALADSLSNAEIKMMQPSIVGGGFWCNMPKDYSRAFPVSASINTWAFSSEEPIDLAAMQYVETPEGQEMRWPIVWLMRDKGAGLSGGWRGFSIDHDLTPDDCVVFETLDNAGPPNTGKAVKTLKGAAQPKHLPAIRVHIFRARDYEATA